MNTNAPANLKQLSALLRQGEGPAEAQSWAQSEAQSIRLLGALLRGALSARSLADALGMRSKTGALKRTLSEMLSETMIEYTFPDKPNSRLQKYRLSAAGKRVVEGSSR
jgi:ATP-dependent DNA helicase RecG